MAMNMQKMCFSLVPFSLNCAVDWICFSFHFTILREYDYFIRTNSLAGIMSI